MFIPLSAVTRRRLRLTFAWRKHLESRSRFQASKARVSTAAPFVRDRFLRLGAETAPCFMHKAVLFFPTSVAAPLHLVYYELTTNTASPLSRGKRTLNEMVRSVGSPALPPGTVPVRTPFFSPGSLQLTLSDVSRISVKLKWPTAPGAAR